MIDYMAERKMQRYLSGYDDTHASADCYDALAFMFSTKVEKIQQDVQDQYLQIFKSNMWGDRFKEK